MAISKQKLEIQLKATGIKVTKAQLKSLHKQVNMTKSGMNSLGISMASAAVGFYAAARAIGSVINTGRQFQQSMANVKAISQATTVEFKNLSDNAKELGRTTIFTASEVAELQTEFAKLGFSADQIEGVTAGTLALASAVSSDLAEAASVAGSTLRGFNLEVDQTNRVTDVMAMSFSSTALDMNKFADSMKYVAPIANTAGVSLEGATAILGRLANAGISGSMAGTGLRKVLLEAGNAGSKLARRMGGPIESFEDFQQKLLKLREEGLDPISEGADLVGTRAVTAFSIMLNGADDIDVLNDSFKNAGGSAQRMAEVQIDTLTGSMRLATSAMDGLKIEMFEMHEEALQDLVESFTAFISSIDPSDIKAYEASIKVVSQALIAYGAHVAVATVLTKGFTAAIASTGVIPLVLGVTVLGAELIKLTGFFEDGTDAALDQALKVKMTEDAFKNFKAEINGLTKEGLAEELDFQTQSLQEYKDELENTESSLEMMGESYEDYIRLKAEDQSSTGNLIAEYDSYVSLVEKLGTFNGEAALSLEEWIEVQNTQNGTMTDGISTYEEYINSQSDIKAGYRDEAVAIQKKIALTEKEIAVIERRKEKIASDEELAIIAAQKAEIIRLEQAKVDESTKIIEDFQKKYAEKDILKHDLERDRLVAALEDTEMLESEKLEILEQIRDQHTEAEQAYYDNKYEMQKKAADAAKALEADEKKRRKARIKSNTLDMAAERKLHFDQAAALANAAAGLAGEFKNGAKVAARMQQTAAIINMWSGATAALAPPPVGAGPIWGPVLAATVVATGLTNIAQIGKSIGDFAEGGLISGPLHSGGGVNINAEGGEFVMKRSAVEAAGVETMNAINEGEGGSQVNIAFEGNVMSEDFIIDEAIPIIEEAIRRGSSIGIG